MREGALFDLGGRTALVTGGTKGLGKAMARGLAVAGANVCIVSRHEDELKTALEDILRGTESHGCYVVADLGNRDQAVEVAERTLEVLGHVDILVSNAGSNVTQPLEQIDDAVWDNLLTVHLSSPMALTRALVPQMKARAWGRIVYVSSMLGLISKPGRHTYSAVKAGMIGLTRANAVELAPHGITANCLAPGPFLTESSRRLSEDDARVAVDRTAIGRWGDPAEIVGPLLLLVSEAGSFVTGTTVVVDGGCLAK